MDFRQTIQPNRPSGASAPAPTPAAHDAPRHEGMGMPPHGEASTGKWLKVFTVAMLAGIAVLLVAIAFGFGRHHPSSESTFVDNSKYQAVFLTNGQVYFGNVSNMSNQYIRLTNVYYLTQSSTDSSSSSNSSNNYSLVKLGCQQIHDPYDAMVINRSEVSFWENLQDNGKVVSSIKQFKQQNPNGPDCSQVSNQTQASNGSATQGGNTNNTTNNSANK
ncbi:MAG TPA: hypothetical protein VLF59_05875 [Candidatus Saccharimonadales bacterium]|nr:hypothetical protein [Candidatus Saccharimonadales bacterium]